MAEVERLICASGELDDGSKGIRFAVRRYGVERQAFVVRFGGRVYAYLNECGHVPAELDWQPGDFFDYSKLYLICSVHGALYAPDTGQCLGGRCHGKGLHPLTVREADGFVYLIEPEHKNG